MKIITEKKFDDLLKSDPKFKKIWDDCLKLEEMISLCGTDLQNEIRIAFNEKVAEGLDKMILGGK